jgi:tetratricopeptide (TPR) repeat protein
MPKIDREKRGSLFDIWALSINDGQVIEKILASDSAVYRDYANFLGERSLSLTERHRYLARAESLDFGRAKSEYLSGENLLAHFQTRAALRHFEVSYDLLKGIRFYQSLSGENLIDGNEYKELLRSTWFGMAKCRILERAELPEVVNCLNRYLSSEDRASEIQALEDYLRNTGLLPGTLDNNSDDLSRLALRVWLQFKQNKYREIVGLWREFQGHYINIPESEIPDYVRILLLAGDSFQKLDLLYDANDIYQQAFELDAGNLAALVRIRQNWVRLNNETKLGEVDGAIHKLVSPHEINLPSLTLRKGNTFSRLLVFDGQKISLEVKFLDDKVTQRSLIALIFNGAVIDEFYLTNGAGSVKLETKVGENLLQILPVSKTVSLSRIAYHPEAEITDTPSLRRQD